MADLNDPSNSHFSYETSPQLFLFTSLTAGSSHIITATSRLETILKANRIAFRAIDCATDEKARRIWSRRAGKRKLPGLVKAGEVLADFEMVEEWNEYGELKEQLQAATASTTGTKSPALPVLTGEKKENMVPSGKLAMTVPVPVGEQKVPADMFPPADASELHSTSPSAGLPALRTPSNGRNVAERTPYSPDNKESTSMPISQNMDATDGSEMPLHPPRLPAGPSNLSGLEAVTSDPNGLAVQMAGAQLEQKSMGGARVKFSEDQLKGDARDGWAAENSVED